MSGPPKGDHQLLERANLHGLSPFAEMQMRMEALMEQYPVDILYGDDCSRGGHPFAGPRALAAPGFIHTCISVFSSP